MEQTEAMYKANVKEGNEQAEAYPRFVSKKDELQDIYKMHRKKNEGCFSPWSGFP